MIDLNNNNSPKTLEFKLKLYIRDGRISEAQEVVKTLGREFTKEELDKIVARCKENGLIKKLFLVIRIYQLREPTVDEVKETVRNYLDSGAGTQFSQMAKEGIEIRRDHFGAICSVYGTGLFSTFVWSDRFKRLVCFPLDTPRVSMKYGHRFDDERERYSLSSKVTNFN